MNVNKTIIKIKWKRLTRHRQLDLSSRNPDGQHMHTERQTPQANLVCTVIGCLRLSISAIFNNYNKAEVRTL
jgi:hypothetical protein